MAAKRHVWIIVKEDVSGDVKEVVQHLVQVDALAHQPARPHVRDQVAQHYVRVDAPGHQQAQLLVQDRLAQVDVLINVLRHVVILVMIPVLVLVIAHAQEVLLAIVLDVREIVITHAGIIAQMIARTIVPGAVSLLAPTIVQVDAQGHALAIVLGHA